MFQIFVLHTHKFDQSVLDNYDIFFSKIFKRYITFNALLQHWYPKAVVRVIEFGDLSLDPDCQALLKTATIKSKKSH